MDRIWIMTVSYPLALNLRRAFDDAHECPPLALAERPRFGDHHRVADLGFVLLVVRDERRGALLRLAVDVVLHAPLGRDHDALLHLVADDHALDYRFARHRYFAFSFRIVRMRARSRRMVRILPGASSCPIDFWIRMRNNWSSISCVFARSVSASMSLNSAAFMTLSPRQTASQTWS